MSEPTREWRCGDIEAWFADSKLVIEESFVVGSNSRHGMEPRSASRPDCADDEHENRRVRSVAVGV